LRGSARKNNALEGVSLLKFGDEEIEQPAYCRQQPAPRWEYRMKDAAAQKKWEFAIWLC
jgi:hypothetical protein